MPLAMRRHPLGGAETVIYEEIPELSRAEIEAAIYRDDPTDVSIAVLSAALYAADLDWAQAVCLKLSRHRHYNVRGNAVLGLGHLARIHGRLEEDAVKPVIEAALHDPEDFVRGQAEAAADDVEHYLKWELHRPRGGRVTGST
jgi:hypothetical protein